MSEAADARIRHVARVLSATDLGPDVVVNRTATRVEVFQPDRMSGGVWRATFGVRAERLPVEIHGPLFVFDAQGEGEPGAARPSPSVPPAALVLRAWTVRGRLLAMREEGLLMTPAEVGEMLSAVRGLIASMREEGLQDEAGHGARVAALLESHDPGLPTDMAAASPGLR